MGKSPKQGRPKARLPNGFRDIETEEIQGLKAMLRELERVYETYGFEPLETPFLEYTDALGKFLPDQDRPNEGVFSIKDEDEQWLSLRYDLTAPLARYVAEHYEALAKPFRSYRSGWVFRNEKPGPGRFRRYFPLRFATGQPSFSSGTGRFTIGITGRDGTTWHVHLTATEAPQFVDYVDEHT